MQHVVQPDTCFMLCNQIHAATFHTACKTRSHALTPLPTVNFHSIHKFVKRSCFVVFVFFFLCDRHVKATVREDQNTSANFPSDRNSNTD